MPKELPAITSTSHQRKLTDMIVRIDPETRVVTVRFCLSTVCRFSNGELHVSPNCTVEATPEQIAKILTPELHEAVATLAHQLADDQAG